MYRYFSLSSRKYLPCCYCGRHGPLYFASCLCHRHIHTTLHLISFMKVLIHILSVWFWGHTQFSDLCLTLYSVITPNSALGTTCGVWDQTPVGSVQNKLCTGLLSHWHPDFFLYYCFSFLGLSK